MSEAGSKRPVTSDDEKGSVSTQRPQKKRFIYPVVEDSFIRDGFDRVLIELDIGAKAEAAIRCANLIGSMEELILAKSDLAFGQLDDVQPYDQLRLYFVTEWVRQYGLGNRMLDFNYNDFNKYFLLKLERLADGTVCMSPSYVENRTLPFDPIPFIMSALLSDRVGFARHEDYDDTDV